MHEMTDSGEKSLTATFVQVVVLEVVIIVLLVIVGRIFS